MDHLEEARHCIERVQMMKGNEAEDQIDTRLATACALVALVERLDALTVSLTCGEKALQTYTYTHRDD